MSEKNFIIVNDWMLDLGLSPTGLLLFALIYGFTQSCGGFSGSLSFMAQRLRTAKRTVQNQLNAMVADGLIRKETSISAGVKRCVYKTVSQGEQGIAKIATPDEKSAYTHGNFFIPTMAKIATNKEIEKKIENIEHEKRNPTVPAFEADRSNTETGIDEECLAALRANGCLF